MMYCCLVVVMVLSLSTITTSTRPIGPIGHFRYECQPPINKKYTKWYVNSVFDQIDFRFQNNYINNQECTWLITAPEEKMLVRYSLNYYFKVAQPGDYLVVRDGMNESAVMLHNFTAASPLEYLWASSGPYLWVKFKTDQQNTGKGFVLRMEYAANARACSGRNTRLFPGHETIRSPFYPFDYPNNQNCEWRVYKPRFQYISLKFRDFSLVQGDALTIGGTNFTKDSIIPNKWVTLCSDICIFNFMSDQQKTGRGFLIAIKFQERKEACEKRGMQIFSDKEPITSPLYPEYYPVKEQCTWAVTAPEHHVVGFMFADFDLGQGDYVELRDGKNETAVLLESYRSKPKLLNWMTSNGRNLFVSFKSSKHLITFKGFKIKIKFLKMPKACLSSMVSLVNTSVSNITPFNPVYLNNLLCTWLITAPQDQIIRFWFTKYDLAQPGDYLEVRDGVNESAVVLKNVTTKQDLGERWTSSEKYLWIRFKSDENDVAAGFSLTWKFVNKPKVSDPKYSTLRPSPKMFLAKRVVTWVLLGLGSGVLILIFLLFVFIKRRKQMKERSSAYNDPWEIDISQVELLEELGQGAFGKVFKGQMDRNALEAHPTSSNKDKQDISNNMIVAVKRLHEGASAQEHSEFLREIEFMKTVGCHKNIIAMIACCTKEEQPFLVVEFSKHGDLLNLLKDKRNKTYVKFSPCSTNQPIASNSDNKQSLELLLGELISFSWQIAQGMEYLSLKGIVHRDLAARNILVADGFVAKVADFGLSRQLTYQDKLYQALERRKLPLRWMSPEALVDQIFTSKSDVWSYGVVLWEIYSIGKLPYSTLYNEQLLRFLKKGYRMEKPDLCPDELYKVMRSCWCELAQKRPSFSDVVKSIEAVITRDKPYVELMEMAEGDAEYMVPLENSDIDSDVSDMV